VTRNRVSNPRAISASTRVYKRRDSSKKRKWNFIYSTVYNIGPSHLTYPFVLTQRTQHGARIKKNVDS